VKGRSRRGKSTDGCSSGIVPQIVPQRVSTLDKHRHLRGHTKKDVPGVMSLKRLWKMRFGTSAHCSSASLSKRAPSTTRTSLRLFRINDLRAVCRRLSHAGALPSTDAMTFVFSDLKRTEEGRRQKLCKTSLSTLIAYGCCRSGNSRRDRAAFDTHLVESCSRPYLVSSPPSSSDVSQGSDGSAAVARRSIFVSRCHIRISVFTSAAASSR
jgi:hypothetical protein